MSKFEVGDYVRNKGHHYKLKLDEIYKILSVDGEYIMLHDFSQWYESDKFELFQRVNLFKESDEGANPKDLIGIAKPQLNLVPPSSIIYQSLAMKDGANKYNPYNWREKKVQATIYLAAALRHLLTWLDGEDCAEDSGLPHLAHALGTIGIIVDALETGNLIDDRPKKGKAAEIIKRFTKEKK